jgi:predicted AlkP superfamily pyrophosphatase or phosphodiesterase
VKRWNDGKKPHATFGKTWEISVPEGALARLWEPGGHPVWDEDGLGKSFPHPLDGGTEAPGRAFFDAFITSPYGNSFVLETAREIVRSEGLGKDDLPDLLGIGLSTNDWAGHTFGPHSPEVLDITVQTDRQLSEFFGFLQEQVPGGLGRVTIVLSADHGVAPVIPGATGAGMPGGLRDKDEIPVVADAALDAAFGDGEWIRAVLGENLYLNLSTLAEKGIRREEAERIAAEAVAKSDGIYAAYSRTRILEGRLPRNDIGRRVSRSFHPERSGDVVLVEVPYWVTSGGAAGASHGSPHSYDTAVPLLLAGAGVKPGRYAQRVSTLDIAPTLSAILGIPLPSGSEGRILGHLLR